MIAVFLGPPGAGKGTQAKRLARELGAMHLSSGDLLRAERAAGSQLGRQAAAHMDAGRLVPDDLIIEMMLQKMTGAGGKPIMLDGFPRTLAQAEALDRGLSQHGLRVDLVINIDVPDGEIERRMSGRRSCPTCGAVYHVAFAPPKVPDRCDRDATALVQRQDDRPEVVRSRLATYHQQTQPLVDYYQSKSVLTDIDGTGSPEKVEAAVAAALA